MFKTKVSALPDERLCRAPELEFGLPGCSSKVDIWSAGIIVQELLTCQDWKRGPRPSKEKKVPLLRWMEGVCGLIANTTLLGCETSPQWQQQLGRFRHAPPPAGSCPFDQPMRPVPEQAAVLASQVLQLRGEARFDAQAALSHPWLEVPQPQSSATRRRLSRKSSDPQRVCAAEEFTSNVAVEQASPGGRHARVLANDQALLGSGQTQPAHQPATAESKCACSGKCGLGERRRQELGLPKVHNWNKQPHTCFWAPSAGMAYCRFCKCAHG